MSGLARTPGQTNPKKGEETMPSEHPPEVKAEVMAALLAGQGVTETAEQYNIPKSTVSRWKKKARQEAGRTDDVGALLLEYLTENLTTLRAQARAFRDPEWLRAQDAADAAVLHGVLTDKAVRLLEALEGAPVAPTVASNGTGRDPRNRVAGHV